jgi:hypothetical protein
MSSISASEHLFRLIDPGCTSVEQGAVIQCRPVRHSQSKQLRLLAFSAVGQAKSVRRTRRLRSSRPRNPMMMRKPRRPNATSRALILLICRPQSLSSSRTADATMRPKGEGERGLRVIMVLRDARFCFPGTQFRGDPDRAVLKLC